MLESFSVSLSHLQSRLEHADTAELDTDKSDNFEKEAKSFFASFGHC